ncbi:hypothetical protein Hdeb2414_s0018g00523411 [Helianthus debilis subsp. tardiflorus]
MSSFSVLSTYTPQPPKPSLRRLPHSESGQGAFVETNRHRFPVYIPLIFVRSTNVMLYVLYI